MFFDRKITVTSDVFLTRCLSYHLIGDRFAESKTKAHDTQQSLWNVNRVDQPVESTKWLNHFRTMNMKYLSEVSYHLLVRVIVAFTLNRVNSNFL